MVERASKEAGAARGDFGPLAALCLLTLGELRVLERLLYVDAAQYGFVLESIRGVLAGTPVSKSWQHRLFAPHLMQLVELFRSEPLAALETFTEVFVWAANLLLFVLSRKKGARPWPAFFVCAGFVLARLLLTYKLEYPWDEIDALLFLTFGYGAFAGWSLLRMTPLLLVGVVNHETALCLPLWFLLAPVERPLRPTIRRDVLQGAAAAAVMVAIIVLLRAHFYVGRPVLEGQVFETPAPLIENHLHVLHNLRQLFHYDWVDGRVFYPVAFFAAVAAAVGGIVCGKLVQASWWTLVFLSTIVAFGYVNETRHYLPLLAFWVIYAAPFVRSA